MIYEVHGKLMYANALDFGSIIPSLRAGIYGEHCDVLLDDTLYPQSASLHLRYRHICGQG